MSNISAPQFIPQDQKHMHVPHTPEDDGTETKAQGMATGQQRQPWTGSGKGLAAPQRGAFTTRERSLSLAGGSEAYGIPSPIQEGSFGSYQFKMG